MKVLLVGDLHFSRYSSIVRSRGQNFSTRLEYIIKSLNWLEDISSKYNCEEEIFLGDFFDAEDLLAEEISALSEIEWNKGSKTRHFIVGNHESDVASLVYNSTQSLSKVGIVESIPYIYSLDDNTDVLFLPYILEDNRKPLVEYLKDYKRSDKKLIICSHNDIKDYNFGGFISKFGFSLNEIEENCDLYINGHLHNGNWLTKKILNLGNIVGQNFSEDAFRYEHHIAILDTDTLKLEFIENPYALNFYKVDINSVSDIEIFDKMKNNAVIAIKCLLSLKTALLAKLETLKNLVSYKVIYENDLTVEAVDTKVEINKKDHLEQFREYIIETLGNTDVVLEELSEVCK